MQSESRPADPRLTVVICTYNNASTLATTLEHLAKQDAVGTSFAVIVIDNNSTDATAQIADEAVRAQRISGLRRIVEPRQGQVYARLRGVAESRSEWVAFVDDDNFLDANWVRCALEFAAAHPRCGAFGGRVQIVWETPPPEPVKRRPYAYAETAMGDEPILLRGEERWRVRGAGLVCRRRALEETGWPEWQACVGRAGSGTMAGDDLEIVMRIARDGWEIWHAPACSLRHFIASRRLSLESLAALHLGFGAADPVMLGFKSRLTFLAWTKKLVAYCAGRVFWLARHALRGVTDPDERINARLTAATLRGIWRGLPLIWKMSAPERKMWLGNDGGKSRQTEAPSASAAHDTA